MGRKRTAYSTAVKEYKKEIQQPKKDKDATSKRLGEAIVERDFIVEKLKSLVPSKDRVVYMDNNLSPNKQLLNTINKIHTRFPCYSTRRVG